MEETDQEQQHRQEEKVAQHFSLPALQARLFACRSECQRQLQQYGPWLLKNASTNPRTMIKIAAVCALFVHVQVMVIQSLNSSSLFEDGGDTSTLLEVQAQVPPRRLLGGGLFGGGGQQPSQQQPLIPLQGNLQMDLLVPIYQADDKFKEFAARLRPALEQYAERSRRSMAANLTTTSTSSGTVTSNPHSTIGTFRLLSTRYTDSEKASSKQLQKELSAATGLPLDQIVLVDVPGHDTSFSRAHAVNLLLNHACHTPNCLVARIDVDMQLRPTFFVNAQTVVAGKPNQVYFPIVWSAYHPMSPKLVQHALDVQQAAKNMPRIVLDEYSEHKGHWRDYGTGMWCLSGPDAAGYRFDETFQGWGGEDGDFYNRVKAHRQVVRFRETGLIHLWHPKFCTKGVTVFTDTQINECNWSRDGEKGSEWGRRLLDKWLLQHGWDDQGVTRRIATPQLWRA